MSKMNLTHFVLLNHDDAVICNSIVGTINWECTKFYKEGGTENKHYLSHVIY